MPSGGFRFFGKPLVRERLIKPNRSRIMSNLITLAALRISESNPNHHLWNNNGTWFLHYTVYPTPFTKERIRRSLGTKDVNTARERRDQFFGHLAKSAGTSVGVGQVAVA